MVLYKLRSQTTPCPNISDTLASNTLNLFWASWISTK